MTEQIYKTILQFYNRSIENRIHVFPIQLYQGFNQRFSYGYFSSQKTYRIFHYILKTLNKPKGVSDDIIVRALTITIRPESVDILRQNYKSCMDELINLNYLIKCDSRGYDYLVNPYFYNRLSEPQRQHIYNEMLLLIPQPEQLALDLPLQFDLVEE